MIQKSYFEQAVALIENHSEYAEFGEPKSDEVIHKFEENLGIKFPSSYRKFLKQYGAGAFGSYEFYGIDQFGGGGFSEASSSRRLLGIPTHFVVIYSVGEGTEFVIDTSQRNNQGACPILAVSIQYEIGDELEFIANSFEEFFYTTIKDAVDRYRNDQN